MQGFASSGVSFPVTRRSIAVIKDSPVTDWAELGRELSNWP
jgi:hypothetical protein